MKIDYSLMGSNENPLYLDFWPVVSRIWKTVFNITPVLGLITDDETLNIDETYGKVFKFKKIEGYDTGYLSQIVRLYLPLFLKGNCIVSDIDMFPMSKKYFIDNIDNFDDSEFFILSSHHPQTINKNQYPMCYVLGNDKLYKELFNLNQDWESFVSSIKNDGWYTDQIFLYNQIKNNKHITFRFPNRNSDFTKDRIDRVNWEYDPSKVIRGDYIDCHSLRPYPEHKNDVDKLLDLLTL